MVEALLSARGVCKSYPGVQALSDVSLDLNRGEVLAVVGENGAGKSTLMKILAGIEMPDGGELRLNGRTLRLGSVRAAERAGIVLIHQELNLADDLDVAANVFLGREPTWGGALRLLHRRIYADTQRILDRLGLRVSPWTRVGTLAPGPRQLVEIARALSLQSRVLILDEPTSSLTTNETERLFQVLDELRLSGVSLIYISHRLREVERLADRAMVLRDGKCVGTLSRGEIQPDRLIPLMVGRPTSIATSRPPSSVNLKAPAATKEGKNQTSTELASEGPEHRMPPKIRLCVEGLRWSSRQRESVSFQIRAGEIVGMAGLIGAGRTELAETLVGLRPHLAGCVYVDGQKLRLGSPRAAMQKGLFLVPEDRRGQGLLLEDSVCRNISLAALNKLQRFGLIRFRAERHLAEHMQIRLSIRTPHLNKAAGLLSGGNQQKVVIAKGLARHPTVLILDEPTRGVDVGAKAELYQLLRQLVNQGLAVLMISSDMEEILSQSDRVLVMHEGRLTGELLREHLSEEAVLRLATAAPSLREHQSSTISYHHSES
jgi:ribose transport system ATP-binding protein